MSTYPDSVRYLYSLGNEIRTIKLGLGRMQALLAELGHPEKACRYVHVAGTNGKGSVCAMLESGLRAAGFRTGLYTSPHLVEPTERIRLDGCPVSEQRFVAAFDRVHRTAETLYRHGELDTHPTYFETVTAMAFVLFAELRPDIVVLEVGLGGRLDATNVIQPRLCVITRIDYDHEAYLGNSLESIAGEKAGILKAGVPAVLSPQRPEAAQVLEQRSAELAVSVIRAEEWRIADLEIHPFGSRFTASRGAESIPVECPLAGEHQVENALTALAALRALGLSPAAISEGIRRASWPGRLERIRQAPEVILDGAHNPAGMRALAAYIRRFYQGRRIRVIYGSMRDKSLDEIAGILSPLAHEVILTYFNSHRALRPEVLCRLFDSPSVRLASNFAEAWAEVAGAGPGEAIFITGSLLLVGEARKFFAG